MAITQLLVTFDHDPRPGTATSVSSPSLTPCMWYLQVCSLDTRGNWSAAVNQGPYVISAAATIAIRAR